MHIVEFTGLFHTIPVPAGCSVSIQGKHQGISGTAVAGAVHPETGGVVHACVEEDFGPSNRGGVLMQPGREFGPFSFDTVVVLHWTTASGQPSASMDTNGKQKIFHRKFNYDGGGSWDFEFHVHVTSP